MIRLSDIERGDKVQIEGVVGPVTVLALDRIADNITIDSGGSAVTLSGYRVWSVLRERPNKRGAFYWME